MWGAGKAYYINMVEAQRVHADGGDDDEGEAADRDRATPLDGPSGSVGPRGWMNSSQ